MSFRFVFILFLTCLGLSAEAGPLNPSGLHYFKFEDALRDPEVVKVLNPKIQIVWAAKPPELAIAEQAHTDSYWRRFKRPSFSSVQSRCMEIFAEALEAMINDALLREFDVIYDLHGIYDDARHKDENVFVCDHGFRFTDVTIGGTFGLSQTGATNLEKLRSDPENQARILNRVLAPDTLLLPLGPILESAEAQAILQGIKTHWGWNDAPKFVERFGPDDYAEDANINKFGSEGACKQAVLNALTNMVKDVRKLKYNGLIRIRSHYKNQWAPDDKKLECDVGGSSAKIKLMATQVKLQ